MEHVSFDVIVIGSGAAGLRAAISAREAGLSVCVVSKGGPGKSTCTWFSGGVMAGNTGGDSRDSHRQRTVAAGRGLNESRLVDILVAEAPVRLNELKRWGIRAELINGYLYAQGRPPVFGEEIVRCLLARNGALGTRLWGNLLVTDVRFRDGLGGMSAFERLSGKWVALTAKAVVIATGGAGGLYQRSDNPRRILGDGYRLALEAGATLQDMEFVQFYPLCLAEPGSSPVLFPPRMADRGRLLTDDGDDIYDKYAITERPAGERARDRLSQALFTEVYQNRKNAWLDLRGLSQEDWRVDPFGASMQGLLCGRYGAAVRPLRVAPAAHHNMGGVETGADGATAVPGFFAAGEVAGGLHGANRMGGNALSETLVFGARAGSAAAAWADRPESGDHRSLLRELEDCANLWSSGAAESPELAERLRKTMWENGGIIRDEGGLSRALATVQAIQQAVRPRASQPSGKALLDRVELHTAAQVAGIILEAALMRRESRGAHFRADCPGQNDAEWQGHLRVRLSEKGEHLWRFDPIAAAREPAAAATQGRPTESEARNG